MGVLEVSSSLFAFAGIKKHNLSKMCPLLEEVFLELSGIERKLADRRSERAAYSSVTSLMGSIVQPFFDTPMSFVPKDYVTTKAILSESRKRFVAWKLNIKKRDEAKILIWDLLKTPMTVKCICKETNLNEFMVRNIVQSYSKVGKTIRLETDIRTEKGSRIYAWVRA